MYNIHSSKRNLQREAAKERDGSLPNDSRTHVVKRKGSCFRLGKAAVVGSHNQDFPSLCLDFAALEFDSEAHVQSNGPR